jgi:hypothetical protein
MTRIAKALNGHPAFAEVSREFFAGSVSPAEADGLLVPDDGAEMLYHRAYHGEIVWGRTTHTDKDGARACAWTSPRRTGSPSRPGPQDRP